MTCFYALPVVQCNQPIKSLVDYNKKKESAISHCQISKTQICKPTPCLAQAID